jgi:hypothetical protein
MFIDLLSTIEWTVEVLVRSRSTVTAASYRPRAVIGPSLDGVSSDCNSPGFVDNGLSTILYRNIELVRLLITGASGSGTTTLGEAISSEKGWKSVDADDFYWLRTEPPYQAKRDHPARLNLILAELERHKHAVVSGSVMNWGPALEDSFDLIVFLYLEASIRLERLKIREERELGTVDPEFLQWASEYDMSPASVRSLVKHEKWLSGRGSKILRIEGDLSVQQRCELLFDALPKDI